MAQTMREGQHRTEAATAAYDERYATLSIALRQLRFPSRKALPRSHLEFELAFLGHAFERFARILDPILVIVAVGRQQPNHLVAAARTWARDRARRVGHGLADAEPVGPQRRQR